MPARRLAAAVPAVLAAWSLAAGVLVAWILTSGCGSSEGSEKAGPVRPHILLITVDGLRADAVFGARREVVPNLQSRIEGGAWHAVGVAPSSDTASSVASLLTGLRPWQHQVLGPEQPLLRSPVVTLAERLRDLGYRTVAFPSGYWSQRSLGFRQGFQDYWRTGRLAQVVEHVARGARDAPDVPWFRWVHLNEPRPPFDLRPGDLELLAPEVRKLRLPSRLTRGNLERYRSPLRPLPARQHARFRALYDLATHTIDKRIGRVLDALEESGESQRTLVVITSAHGEELGEHGQILHGNNLGRASLEVPLLMLWPQSPAVGGAGAPEVPEAPVATRRLWATLVEAAGGRGTPGAAPSLHDETAGEAILSELYDADGVNRFSLLTDGLQLRRRVRLAGPFDQVLPFDGSYPEEVPMRPILVLEQWLEDGSVEGVKDPSAARDLDQEMRRIWHRFIDAQRTPAQESVVWGWQ